MLTSELIESAIAGLRAQALATEADMADAEAKAESFERQARASWDMYFEADRQRKRLAVLIEALEAL